MVDIDIHYDGCTEAVTSNVYVRKKKIQSAFKVTTLDAFMFHIC